MRRGAAGLKPQRPPIVGYMNMQKSRVEIGGSGYKSMAKIATLHDNKSYIPPPMGPPVQGQYSKGQGPRIRGISLSGSPQGPGWGRGILILDVINHCK